MSKITLSLHSTDAAHSLTASKELDASEADQMGSQERCLLFGSFPTTGLVLDANAGDPIGGFTSDMPPASIGNLVLYVYDGTLVGADTSSGQQLWSFAADGELTSAPLIVNQTIYIGSPFGIGH